ncbi:MAG: hypothetical protein MUF83_10320 [Acidimicrobiales bacterium]|jgi:hypothetical protein|nr:hypothetical protein [Acidimicrobiales bacterium]
MEEDTSVDGIASGVPIEVIERIRLNDTEEGKRLAASFVHLFGEFISREVRPLLREVAGKGDEPQLIVNGLAELLRATADSIEFPLDHPRAGSRPRSAPPT